jgi:hypothetical protein
MRLVPALERRPGLVAFVATLRGRLVLLAAFTALLVLARFPWPYHAAAILAATSLLPRRRRLVLTIGVLAWTAVHPVLDRTALLLLVARQEGVAGTLDVFRTHQLVLLATIALLGVVAAVAFRWHRSRLARRPILLLHLACGTLLLWASCAPLAGTARVVAWAFAATLCGYLWYFGYTLLDRHAADRDPVLLQVGTWSPFWAATRAHQVPFAKGAAYWRRIEAKTDWDLAVVQLKAIKLLVWALIMRATLSLFWLLVHGVDDTTVSARIVRKLGSLAGWTLTGLHLPTFAHALAKSIERRPFGSLVCWATLVAYFLERLLTLTFDGGVVIACVRMAGFAALRNTWRPLQARSIADFWNRYFFYFKEMLVDFFFYPTFVRVFKRHTNARIVAATFVAAGFGNMEFHFLRNPQFIVQLGLWRAVAGFQVYAFYTVVLAMGIAVSQIRARRAPRPPPRGFRGRVLTPAAVVLFYCLLSIFDEVGRSHPLSEHFRFLLHLFAIG